MRNTASIKPPAKYENKKCANQSQRTENANSDCRQTNRKKGNIKPIGYTFRGICGFTEFIQSITKKGYSYSLKEKTFPRLFDLFGNSIIPHFIIKVKGKIKKHTRIGCAKVHL